MIYIILLQYNVFILENYEIEIKIHYFFNLIFTVVTLRARKLFSEDRASLFIFKILSIDPNPQDEFEAHLTSRSVFT